jgi:hypothetical protein
MARRALDSMRYIWLAEYPRLHPQLWKPEHGYAYFQEFLPGNDFDTRISVIGNRAFGFRRMNRPDDFRASGSGDILVDPGSIDPRCIEMAFRTSQQGRFQCMAYDFLFKEGDPVITEVSYTFTDWMVYSCPGHWDSALNWLDGQMWPEEAQVDDFLDQVRCGGSGRVGNNRRQSFY